MELRICKMRELKKKGREEEGETAPRFKSERDVNSLQSLFHTGVHKELRILKVTSNNMQIPPLLK